MNTNPRIGFISLGCPKALVDSERILTQLRAEGYQTSSRYDDADLIIINTCGFIDAAIEESLDTIGEALEKNGRVIVTGCLGVDSEKILSRHPNVLGVTGPHAYEEVMAEVHSHLPRPDDRFTSLLPDTGVKLTPRHYAYLRFPKAATTAVHSASSPSSGAIW
jgi:ribosomal protein S12 methylthiotransferase